MEKKTTIGDLFSDFFAMLIFGVISTAGLFFVGVLIFNIIELLTGTPLNEIHACIIAIGMLIIMLTCLHFAGGDEYAVYVWIPFVFWILFVIAGHLNLVNNVPSGLIWYIPAVIVVFIFGPCREAKKKNDAIKAKEYEKYLEEQKQKKLQEEQLQRELQQRELEEARKKQEMEEQKLLADMKHEALQKRIKKAEADADERMSHSSLVGEIARCILPVFKQIVENVDTEAHMKVHVRLAVEVRADTIDYYDASTPGNKSRFVFKEEGIAEKLTPIYRKALCKALATELRLLILEAFPIDPERKMVQADLENAVVLISDHSYVYGCDDTAPEYDENSHAYVVILYQASRDKAERYF